MGVYEDIELMYISAFENYKLKSNLDEEMIYNLFLQNQMYDKLLSTYESLHQLDIVEVYNYVDEIIKNNENILKVYHGTNCIFEDIDLTKSKNYRDFGRGYYCTTIKNQAIAWAKQMKKRKLKGQAYVYEYNLKYAPNLKIKRFKTIDEEWLEFIKLNRKNINLMHDYDIVIGPIADDNTFQTVQFYAAGLYNAKEAIERLRYNNVNNQISFHTKKAVECLTFVARKEYD